MRRQRNKVRRLGRNYRALVIEGLLDGLTYEDIRDELRAAGCPDDKLPGDSSFAAYRQRSPEYAAAERQWVDVLTRAAARRAAGLAIDLEDLEGAAKDLGLQVVPYLEEAMRDGTVDASRAVTAVSTFLRTVRDSKTAEMQDRIRELQAQIEQLTAEQQNTGKPADLAAIAATMDAVLRGAA